MLGIVFATLYPSASKAVPRAATRRTPRIKPVIREIMVPIAITLEARYRSTGFIFYPFALDELFAKSPQQKVKLQR